MKEIKLKATNDVVELFDDIREMPMNKYNAFQIALLQDNGMGSNITDINSRLNRLDAFLGANKVPEAILERQNMTFGLFFLLQGINTKSLCLAHLVATINGIPVKDSTDDDILKTAKKLENGGLTYLQVLTLVDELKKKLISESKAAFLN